LPKFYRIASLAFLVVIPEGDLCLLLLLPLLLSLLLPLLLPLFLPAGCFFGSRPCVFGSRPCVFGSRPCLFGLRPCFLVYALAFLVVIPEGDLRLLLPLPLSLPLLLSLSLPLFVSAVILSAAKDPGTLCTTHTASTFQPESRLFPSKRK
jgi:hypothetical protein